MALKSTLLNFFAASLIIGFCTSTDIPNFSPAICKAEKLIAGLECTPCNFLTFGQDEIVPGVGYICPNSKKDENYCCYNHLRQPFCCDSQTYYFTGFLWIIAVLAVIGAIAKFIKCMVS